YGCVNSLLLTRTWPQEYWTPSSLLVIRKFTPVSVNCSTAWRAGTRSSHGVAGDGFSCPFPEALAKAEIQCFIRSECRRQCRRSSTTTYLFIAASSYQSSRALKTRLCWSTTFQVPVHKLATRGTSSKNS